MENEHPFLLKVERTAAALKTKNVSVGEGVKSTTYIRIKSESEGREGISPSVLLSNLCGFSPVDGSRSVNLSNHERKTFFFKLSAKKLRA